MSRVQLASVASPLRCLCWLSDWLSSEQVKPGLATLRCRLSVLCCVLLGRYGPPFRLPQQLLVGSAVLRMTSPYQTWLDWDLVPGKHLQEFAYDLTDMEEQLTQQLGLSGSSSISASSGSEAGKDGGSSSSSEAASGRDDAARAALQAMATAARALVASRVHVTAQLDAFAWSIARYKQACAWEVERPAAGDATWQVLTFGADLFTAKGVPASVHLEVMQHLRANFEAALQHPALLQGGLGG